MSKKNSRIREQLAATAQEQRGKNRFYFGKTEIKIDHDSPLNGFEFVEYVRVSVYNPDTDVDMVFHVPVLEVQFIENALTD